mmetsp:Transcript_1326/g.5274  ORF Transcript_1326/g.5274 Transcript_1326/m.5274 type:complete len:526 (-) Transcript_1326:35-1612(-)|eukprot:PRCOL_00000732-RA
MGGGRGGSGGEGDGNSPGTPVFVMMPLDTLAPGRRLDSGAAEGCESERASGVRSALRALRRVGVAGVMVDVWWCAVEQQGPGEYDWRALRALVQLCKAEDLQLQCVMSFHACGGNVGDRESGAGEVPLPPWVLQAGERDPSMFYTDAQGVASKECLSLWASEAPVLAGRTPMQAYAHFIRAFVDACGNDIGPGRCVTEIIVGSGPCGELRYPSYPLGDGRWQFPGVGEFQSYDKRARASLQAAARRAGRPEWGESPRGAGRYNSIVSEESAPFFVSGADSHGVQAKGDRYDSDYGRFFLEWYCGSLLDHGGRMLGMARQILDDLPAHRRPFLALKVAGVHWWYDHPSHAAELTAGYFNTLSVDAYARLVDVCASTGTRLIFTCAEMEDTDQPQHACSSPERLLCQVRLAAAARGVQLLGENALFRVDERAMARMGRASRAASVPDAHAPGGARALPAMGAFTFLRMREELFEPKVFARFAAFVRELGGTRAGDGGGGTSYEESALLGAGAPASAPEHNTSTVALA